MKFLLVSFALIAATSAAVLSPDQPIPIVRQAQNLEADGSYSFSYETANGIVAQESGTGGHVAQGGVQWTSPEGVPVQITYVADENGYQPQGAVVPQVPELIARALVWSAAHPYVEETAGKKAVYGR